MKRIASEVAKTSDEEIRSQVKAGERPTLKTISRISGMAVATVSRALSDAPDIGSDTKDLVHRIANTIGYVPNRAGVRLRTGRTNVITLVIPAEADVMTNAARLTSSIAGELRGTQFHLNILPWFPDEDPLKPIKYIVETRSADAVIFNMTEPEDRRVAYLMEHKFPFATHGRTNWCDQHAYYDYDNTSFISGALKRLTERGRSNVLAILPNLKQFYAQDMVRGLERNSERLNIRYRIAQNVDSDRTAEDIRHWVTRRLEQSPEIDAIICSSSKGAIAAVVAAEEKGRVLGSDIDVYTKEAAPILKTFRENIIVEIEDVGEAGRFLAKAVTRQLKHPEQKLMQYLFVPNDQAS
ncbi:LacI family transcriptional regulator [Boseongicola aestuarii]|uniref:HTH-type transcriptional regulator RafR n=1 Tax=Boseongicola aestuarii TaxID=1470561 RepID=A0A238IZ54_9RHOB|nr:LacI family transcriptional regulator [Boseongicola aestuarii]SMX23687.1 HTH-type transcriptional regulator RafR [Boseongicola aestuarii]